MGRCVHRWAKRRPDSDRKPVARDWHIRRGLPSPGIRRAPPDGHGHGQGHESSRGRHDEVSGVEAMKRLTIGLICIALAGTAAAQDPMNAARDLYASASYE